MKKQLQYIVLFVGACLSACETLVTDIPQSKLPSTSSKLVVNAYISPQNTRTIVVVTESIPLFGESTSGDKVITKAIVKLSNGGKEVTLPYDSTGKVYTISQTLFPIKASETYTITVTDGVRTVNSTCTVPAKAPAIQSYVLDTVNVRNFDGRDTAITLKVNWLDIPGERNYYRVRGFTEVEYSVLQSGSSEMQEKRVKGRFNFDWDDNIGRSNFQNDVNLDGTLFTSPLGKSSLPSTLLYYSTAGPVYAKQKVKLLSVTIEVLNTDQPYFDYHKSLNLTSNTENPFAEPALVFSNIQGGLGCFAAYNSRQIIYKP
jgi:hypothetical protein